MKGRKQGRETERGSENTTEQSNDLALPAIVKGKEEGGTKT